MYDERGERGGYCELSDAELTGPKGRVIWKDANAALKRRSSTDDDGFTVMMGSR